MTVVFINQFSVLLDSLEKEQKSKASVYRNEKYLAFAYGAVLVV